MPVLPLPSHFNPNQVGSVWRVPYQQRAEEATAWRATHAIPPAAQDSPRVALFLIDVQNTFCIPEFELFVGGRSGSGAVEDNLRLCEFIYRNLGQISHIALTMDTHNAYQVFFQTFLVNSEGEHPAPYSLITKADVDGGHWRFNPALAPSLGLTPDEGQAHLEHYVEQLATAGRFDLTIWPYHALLGGLGHAIVSAVEEAVFFHSIARAAPSEHILKGSHPLTEHYSIVGPEVTHDHQGKQLAPRDSRLTKIVQDYDAVIVTGQAKSHCVGFTLRDLLTDLQAIDPTLARKVFLLEDCTSPVVIPGAVDYTEAANEAYAEFAAAGMRRITASDSIQNWF